MEKEYLVISFSGFSKINSKKPNINYLNNFIRRESIIKTEKDCKLIIIEIKEVILKLLLNLLKSKNI